MTVRSRVLTSTLSLACMAVLACSQVGCGGGLSFGGGIGGTGLVVGPITDFGSIFAEDVEFDVDTATVTIDGQPATQADLKLGMVVSVAGDIASGGATGTADTVDFTSVTAGPVTAVDVAAGSAGVLGDVVLTDEDTVLDGVAIDASDVGRLVRVSGFVDADGSVHATRIEARPTLPELVLSGVVEDLDETAETFRIRRLTVDYAGATLMGVPGDGLRNGLLARVVVTSAPAGTLVTADAVRFAEPLAGADEGRKVLLQGIVTARPTARSFVLDDAALVRFESGTEFVGGTAADLLLNTRVRVAGVALAGRVVGAYVVAFPRATIAAASSPVAAP